MENNALTNEFVQETYNKMLADYDETYTHFRWFREPISRFHYKLSRRTFLSAMKGRSYDRALEIGGGDGEWTKVLTSHASSIDFYDISEEMLKRAKKRLADIEGITYYLGDFVKNELPDAQYDFVQLFRSFEYFDDKDKGMSELSRVLKSGGEIAMVTKSKKYDWSKYYETKRLHGGVMTVREMRALFAKHGFTVTSMKPAIVGKLLRFSFARAIFSVFHALLIHIPTALLPLTLLEYISESFVIILKKQ